jgi:hypothetical protein
MRAGLPAVLSNTPAPTSNVEGREGHENRMESTTGVCATGVYTALLQVVPVTEMLQSTCSRYHDLLGVVLQSQLQSVVEADVLGELEVRSEAQHRQLAEEYNLPWQLEGAGEGSGVRVCWGCKAWLAAAVGVEKCGMLPSAVCALAACGWACAAAACLCRSVIQFM